MPQAERLPNGLPALKPLKGVNVDTLFAENIKSTDRRFDRLENAVVDMRREFEAVKPAIANGFTSTANQQRCYSGNGTQANAYQP